MSLIGKLPGDRALKSFSAIPDTCLLIFIGNVIFTIIKYQGWDQQRHRGWGDGSAVKSVHCSCRGPEVRSQDPCQAPQNYPLWAHILPPTDNTHTHTKHIIIF